MSASPEYPHTPDAHAFDACWQRIGIHGDRSCERLVHHVHCHNCERYAEAATQLLDRHEVLLQADDSASPADEWAPATKEADATLSTLIFRIGQNWLALPSTFLLEVSVPSTVHTLPYPRSRSLRGLCNVRGALVPCLAPDILLGLAADTSPQDLPRMLILDAPGGALVMQVHAVEGVYALPLALLQETHHASGLAASQLSAAVFQWKTHSVTLLDTERLTQAMLRSLG